MRNILLLFCCLVSISPFIMAQNASLQVLSVDLNRYTKVGTHPITSQVKNDGDTPIQSLTLHWQVNEETVHSYTYHNLNIAPNSTYTFTHPEKWQAAIANYDLKVWASHINEQATANSNTLNLKLSGASAVYKQQLLLEHFTAEHCGLCSTHNPGFYDLIAAYGEDIALMTSHVNWWQGSIYVQTPEEHDARLNRYGVASSPRGVLNGTTPDIAVQNLTTSNIDATLAATSPINVVLNETLSGNTVTFNVTVTPTATLAGSNVKVFIAVTEDLDFINAPGVNGETYFPATLRKMLPSNDGTSLTSLFEGVPTTINTSHTFPAYVNFNNAHTIVFVQGDDNTVYQTFIAPNSTGSNNNVSPNEIGGSTPTVTVQTQLFLEGAYDTGTSMMTTGINDLLPSTQPYNQAPWNYGGNETVLTMPTNIVDWILVETYNTSYDLVAARAALLRNDGMVVDTDGTTGVDFNDISENGFYYIAIRHRNHLAVISSNLVQVPNTTTYTFTQPANIEGTAQVASVGNGQYALLAGDFNSDGVISVADFNAYQQEISFINQYVDSDCNLNSSVTVGDFNVFKPNSSVIGVSQIRY